MRGCRTWQPSWFCQCAAEHLLQVLDAQNEANGVQDVALAAAIKACDGVEGLVEVRQGHALGVALEALNANLPVKLAKGKC